MPAEPPFPPAPHAPVGPLPVPDAASRPFWRAAAGGTLALPRCGCSARFLFPPPSRCPRCLGDAFQWVALSGRGRLWSWTEVVVPWGGEGGSTVRIAQLAPDEQPDLRLIAADPRGVVLRCAIGDPVSIAFRRVSEDIGLAELAPAPAHG